VVFEGVDGSGKTTLANALADYYRTVRPAISLYHGSFPGADPGTLGEWVYRLHHQNIPGEIGPGVIAAPALQLLHVASHVDAILLRIGPVFRHGGVVILDRYWWSTYAYARRNLPPDLAWPLVEAERPFWHDLPVPIAIYLTRRLSLKAHEIDSEAHLSIDAAYHEVVAKERQRSVVVHELENDGSLENTWQTLLDVLNLPFRPMVKKA
jgi:thymidylate kinase